MSPKDSFWIGAKGGLLDQKHVKNMGVAIWMFMYLLRNQTGLNVGGEGIVNYGHPLTLWQINSDFKGTPQGTLRRWIARLRRNGYVRTEDHSNKGLTFWIAKGKSKTKVPRIQREVTSKLTKNLRAKMNESFKNLRPALNESQPNSRDNLDGSLSQPPSQFIESRGVAPVSETPTPKGLNSENLYYYNNPADAKKASVFFPSLNALAEEKSIPRARSQSELEERQRLLHRQGRDVIKKFAAIRPPSDPGS